MRSLFLPFLIITSLHGESLQAPLRVGIYDNKPKVFTDQEGKPAGFFVEVLSTIAKEAGWELEYHPCLWDECLQKLEEGALDVMVDVAQTQDRSERFAFHQEGLISSWSVLYTQKGSPVETILDLDGKKITVLAGSMQYKSLREQTTLFGITPMYIEVAAFDSACTLLKNKKVDAALFNRFYGQENKERCNGESTSILVAPSILKFAFRRDIPAHVPLLIDASLRTMKQDPHSVYHKAKERWLDAGSTSENHPQWILWLLGIAVVGLVVALGAIRIFLRLLARERKKA